MKSRFLITMAALMLIVGIFAGIAGATSHTENGDVDFTVDQSLELTAANISLGNVTPGTNGPTDKNPFTVSSNVDWNVTAHGDDFSDGALVPTTLGIENLTMGSNALNGDNSTVVVIASGSAGESLAPNVATTLQVPWANNLGGVAFSASITYTAVPQ